MCKLPNYEDILNLLDRAFGDPNRVNNARNDLFRLRQTHKDFSTFFAEFQRLALEGEMSEDALPTLLEQAISRELRGMLMHNEPPSREYHQFASFLQDLENRRRHYETAPSHTLRSYTAATRPAIPTANPRQKLTNQPIPPQLQTPIKSHDPDTMDTSALRTRKARGECFRYSSSSYHVRDCPHPDNRLGKTMGPTQGRPNSYLSHGSQPSSSPAPTRSVNGVSLE